MYFSIFGAMIESLILGLAQGLAEFLPISSSGHLVLGEHILNMQQVGILFDVMLHFGTLLAVILVFRKKLWKLIVGCLKRDKEELRYALYITIASIPTAIIGLGFKDAIESLFESPRFVCYALLVTGTFLFATQWARTGSRHPEAQGVEMNWWRALIVGTIQGVACIPGISRSGSTISSMLFLGVNRKYAGEFSFLMSLPAVGGAALLAFIDWVKCRGAGDRIAECANSGNIDFALICGVVVAFVSGIIALKWLLNFVQKGKLHYFSYYVWAVGILGLIFIR